jgi:hypothetical protein
VGTEYEIYFKKAGGNVMLLRDIAPTVLDPDPETEELCRVVAGIEPG